MENRRLLGRRSQPIAAKHRHFLRCAILAAVLLPCLPTGASADYRLCNQARFPLFSAFAYEDKVKGWASVGWFEIKPRSCENVITGSLKGRVLYVTAEGVDAEGVNLLWPREADDLETFCVGQHLGARSSSTKKSSREAVKPTALANGDSAAATAKIGRTTRSVCIGTNPWPRSKKNNWVPRTISGNAAARALAARRWS